MAAPWVGADESIRYGGSVTIASSPTLMTQARRFLCSVSLCVCVGLGNTALAQDREQRPTYDLLITNARVLDGTGNPWFKADVAVRDGMIVAVGALAERTAKRKLDIGGRILAPGFIDLHSHADGGLASKEPARRAAPNLVTQGITTVVVNQDGRGSAPIKAQRKRFTELGIGPNAVLLMGHGTIRQRVMKRKFRRAATDEEIKAMRVILRQGLEAGAYGLSAGLEYVPGRWAETKEMIALVSELAPVGGVYILHERSSGTQPMWYLPSQHPPAQPSMLDNIQELIQVSQETGAVVVATHIKVKGTNFWGSAGALIQLIDRARKRGVRIYADQYPYNTSGTDGRVVLIPRWLRKKVGGEGLNPAEVLEKGLEDQKVASDLRRDIEHEIMRRGGAENIVILDHPNHGFVGKTLQKLADQHRMSPYQMTIELQLKGDRKRRGGARIRGYSMSEADVELLAAQKWTATCTDGGIALPEDRPVHPRFYGAFARKIRHYALERKVISVEHAIRSCTSLPAQILGFRRRGQVREGFHADLVVLDLKRVRDKATALKPHQFSEGFDYVLVAGKFVVDTGKVTGALPGKVITLASRTK